MSDFKRGLMAERAAIPAKTDFIPNWTLLAQESDYCPHRLAKLLQVSVRTLDRYFQKHVSSTVHKWLAGLQLTTAYQQLLAGKPLEEISFPVGFRQPSHFLKRFKARFGVPPSLIFGAANGGCVRWSQTGQEVCRLRAV
jgi:AraC-like DNA-binding protein